MRSRNHFYHGKATVLFLHISFDPHVPVNNIKNLSNVMAKREWFSFALVFSYKLFRTVVNRMNLFRFPCKVLFNP